MCKKVFIAATGQHCGKTTVSLSLMHLASKKYRRVGFMKPIGPKCIQFRGLTVDKDAAMMASVFGVEEDVALMSPMTLTADTTRRFLNGEIDPTHPEKAIMEAYRIMSEKYDFLVIEGAGHGGVGSVLGINNARVASMLNAPVLMVTTGGIGNVIDAVQLNLALFRSENSEVRMIMPNKLIPEKREASLNYLRKAFANSDLLVTSAFDYSSTLAHPTLQHIADLLGLPLKGDPRESSRICKNIQMGAASSQRVIDSLEDSTLLVVTSSRDELLVTASSLHHIPEFKDRLAGLVIGGHAPVSQITKRIIIDSSIPYIRIEETSSEVFYRLREHVSKIGPDDREKIDLINASAQQYIDFEAIDRLL